ncbi:hypothetical protein SALBM311S_12259 [Streptomyces alboniger]
MLLEDGLDVAEVVRGGLGGPGFARGARRRGADGQAGEGADAVGATTLGVMGLLRLPAGSSGAVMSGFSMPRLRWTYPSAPASRNAGAAVAGTLISNCRQPQPRATSSAASARRPRPGRAADLGFVDAGPRPATTGPKDGWVRLQVYRSDGTAVHAHRVVARHRRPR